MISRFDGYPSRVKREGQERGRRDVIWPVDNAARPDAPPAITQRHADALERMVRRHPEQYFWLHRRWKHRPPAQKAARPAA